MTLGEALPLAIKRVMEEVIPAYVEIGAPGKFALAMMRADIDLAHKAMMEGDVAMMLKAYASLKEYKL